MKKFKKIPKWEIKYSIDDIFLQMLTMKILELSENNYYLKSSINFFKTKFEKRYDFINKKKFLFNEISNFLNNCIDTSKNVYIFCAGNSILSKNILSKKIYVKEIDEKYKINYNLMLFIKMRSPMKKLLTVIQ